jgi:hypothetical protein
MQKIPKTRKSIKASDFVHCNNIRIPIKLETSKIIDSQFIEQLAQADEHLKVAIFGGTVETKKQIPPLLFVSDP